MIIENTITAILEAIGFSIYNYSTAYEYSSTGGAERAYKKTVDKLSGLPVDAGVPGAGELKQTDKNKKTPPLHTSAKQCIGMPTATMNGEKYVLTFPPEQRRL